MQIHTSKILLISIFIISQMCCKRVLSVSKTKIIGGTEVGTKDQNDHYFAIVEIDRESNSPKKCGGVFIHERVVVTAAHCVRSVDKGFYYNHTVRLPRSTENKINPEFKVVGKIVHEGFPGKPSLLENDIAVLFLEDWKTKYPDIVVTPIAMNTNLDLAMGANPVHQKTRAFGFGNMSSIGQVLPDVPQMIDIDLMPFDKCKGLPDFAGEGERLSHHILCMGSGELGGKGLCSGDSGSPLVLPEGPKPLLAGIASGVSNFGCAQKSSLSTFSHIAYYRAWITEKLEHFLLNQENNQAYNPRILMMAHCQNVIDPPKEIKDDSKQLSIIQTHILNGKESQEIPPQVYDKLVPRAPSCIVHARQNQDYQFDLMTPKSPDENQQAWVIGHEMKTNKVVNFETTQQTQVSFQCFGDHLVNGDFHFHPHYAGFNEIGFDARSDGEGILGIDGERYVVTKKVAKNNVSSVVWENLCSFDSFSFDLGPMRQGKQDLVQFLRFSGPNLETTYFELMPLKEKEPPHFQIKVVRNSGHAGEIFIKNLTSSDLFTWTLTCPKEMSLKLPSGKVVSTIEEVSGQSEIDQIGFSGGLRSSPVFLFHYPGDEGSAIPARSELRLEYGLSPNKSTKPDQIQKNFKNCKINGEYPLFLYFEKPIIDETFSVP